MQVVAIHVEANVTINHVRKQVSCFVMCFSKHRVKRI